MTTIFNKFYSECYSDFHDTQVRIIASSPSVDIEPGYLVHLYAGHAKFLVVLEKIPPIHDPPDYRKEWLVGRAHDKWQATDRRPRTEGRPFPYLDLKTIFDEVCDVIVADSFFRLR